MNIDIIRSVHIMQVNQKRIDSMVLPPQSALGDSIPWGWVESFLLVQLNGFAQVNRPHYYSLVPRPLTQPGNELEAELIMCQLYMYSLW